MHSLQLMLQNSLTYRSFFCHRLVLCFLAIYCLFCVSLCLDYFSLEISTGAGLFFTCIAFHIITYLPPSNEGGLIKCMPTRKMEAGNHALVYIKNTQFLFWKLRILKYIYRVCLKAVKVFSRSIVIVIGPTPPGTGVI